MDARITQSDADNTFKVLTNIGRGQHPYLQVNRLNVRSVRYRTSGGCGAFESAPHTRHPMNGDGDPQPLKSKKEEKTMKKYEFSWDGIPPKSTFQQRDRNFHQTASCRLAMAQWQAILEPHVPAEPFNGPLSFRMVVTWPHTRESFKQNAGNPVLKTTRPDGVNILKGVEDIMTRLGYWKDDNVLAIETIERWHGDISGALFVIEEL